MNNNNNKKDISLIDNKYTYITQYTHTHTHIHIISNVIKKKHKTRHIVIKTTKTFLNRHILNQPDTTHTMLQNNNTNSSSQQAPPPPSFSPLLQDNKSIFRHNLFQHKVAIVTGGGTGIGKQIARELLELSCTVVIASRKVDKLNDAVIELKSLVPTNQNVSYVQCDIKKEEEIKHLMSTVLEKHHRIDFLINNSGGQFPSSAGRIKTKGWESVISLNLNGTFICCREAFTQWMRNNGGAIVNIVADVWKGKFLLFFFLQ